jgi:hypothetical protein
MLVYTAELPKCVRINKLETNPIYVNNIPLSLQNKLDFHCRNIVIQYKNGNPAITLSRGYTVTGDKANRIIKVLNGFLKSQGMYR